MAEDAEAGALVRVPLPGGMSFTPSEFVRLAVAFFLAQYLAAVRRAVDAIAKFIVAQGK